MKGLLLLLALFDLLLWHKGSVVSTRFLDEECAFLRPSEVMFKIIRGHLAEPGTTPWMAAISNQYEFICGGTLITKNFVLTAAHCIEGQDRLFVKLGVYDRSCSGHSCRDVEYFNISRAIIHNDFELNQYTNDIGLLKLETEVQYNYHIRPICIVMDDSLNATSINEFSVFGWGRTQTGQHSQSLMTISLFRRISKECRFGDMLPLTEKQICAGSAMGDTCEGDSGGPLTTIVGDRYVQVGMVSYGIRTCNASGIYTDVTSYRDWIASKTRNKTIADKLADEADYGDNSISGGVRLLYENCFDTISGPSTMAKQPWSVYNAKLTFSGAIITDRYVVTAASVLDNYSPSNLKFTRKQQTFFVESIIKHPQFEATPQSFVNDIALIRLRERVLFTASFRPICLGSVLKPYKNLTLLNTGGKISLEPIKQIDLYVCERSIGKQVEEDQFCTERSLSNFLQMKGEVVGTIGKIGDTYKYFLSGILIMKNHNVSVFTDIKKHHQWIQDTIF